MSELEAVGSILRRHPNPVIRSAAEAHEVRKLYGTILGAAYQLEGWLAAQARLEESGWVHHLTPRGAIESRRCGY